MSTLSPTAQAEPAEDDSADAPSLDRAKADAARHREVLEALTGLLLGMFVSMIANTVVSTSMPVIIHDIGGDQSAYTWVITSALLSTAIATPVWGKLADLLNRKVLFQIAIVLFTVASAAAGFAHDPTFLIVCRVLQGLAGGGLVALSQVIMADIISPRERGRYMGLFGAVMAVATVGGPLAGGVITDLWGWRWNFFVSLPFALAALLIVQRTLHLPARERRAVRIDYPGILLLAVATSLLLIWITNAGREFEWASATTLWMLVGVAVASALFVVVELRSAEPLIPLALFRDRTFTLATVASIAAGLAMFGSSVYLAQYMQLARGATPTQAGLMTIPMIVGLLVSSTVVGGIITRTGVWKHWLVIGAVLLGVGAALLGTLHYDTPFVLVSLYMFLLGAGVGMTMQNLVLVVQNTSDPRQMGAASSGVTFFRTLGGSVGVAVMGAVVTNVVTSQVTDRSGDIRAALASLGAEGRTWAQSLSSGTLPRVAEMPEALRSIFEDIYATGIGQAFLVAVPLAVVALVAILFLPNIPLGRMTNIQRLDAEGRPAEATLAEEAAVTGTLMTVPAVGTGTAAAAPAEVRPEATAPRRVSTRAAAAPVRRGAAPAGEHPSPARLAAGAAGGAAAGALLVGAAYAVSRLGERRSRTSRRG